jgi:small-conductance mechanosensitive channel
MATVTDIVRSTLTEFLTSITEALPAVLSGLVFLVVAYLFYRFLRMLVRSVLTRAYPAEQGLIVDFGLLVVTVFFWFGAGLVFLRVVGMGDIAASLGTAAGFIALGVSYALSDMIEDTVAGVYLLRDPDFNAGDTVTAASFTGTVSEIGLRKSRFTLEDGDVMVVANRDVESKWTRLVDGEA